MDISLENAILPGEGKEVFPRVLRESLPQVITSTVDFSRRIDRARTAEAPGSPIPQEKTPAVPTHQRPRLNTRYTAPVNELEKTITRVWENLLGIDQVGIDDNFFELGATSLDILQANRRLQDVVEKNLPAAALYKYPTVAELAKYLSGAETGEELTPGDNSQLQEFRKGKSKLKQRGKRIERTENE